MENKTFLEYSLEYLEQETKRSSYNGIVPSKDLSSEEYAIFLECAKPYELELDVVNKETYYAICKELNKPLQKPKFPGSRHIKY